VRSAELCPTAEDPDKVIKDMKKWLTQEGLADLDAVSLFAEKLEQVRLKTLQGCSELIIRKPFKGSKRLRISSIPKRPTILSSELLSMVFHDRLFSNLPMLSTD
jgi:5'-3' exoribonuclease 1